MTFSLDREEAHEAHRELDLWRSADVAAYLNVSEATVSRWRKRGVGPGCIHIAGVARYRPETVRAWIESMEDRNGGASTRP
jgi:hypothetical protein